MEALDRETKKPEFHDGLEQVLSFIAAGGAHRALWRLPQLFSCARRWVLKSCKRMRLGVAMPAAPGPDPPDDLDVLLRLFSANKAWPGGPVSRAGARSNPPAFDSRALPESGWCGEKSPVRYRTSCRRRSPASMKMSTKAITHGVVPLLIQLSDGHALHQYIARPSVHVYRFRVRQVDQASHHHRVVDRIGTVVARGHARPELIQRNTDGPGNGGAGVLSRR